TVTTSTGKLQQAKIFAKKGSNPKEPLATTSRKPKPVAPTREAHKTRSLGKEGVPANLFELPDHPRVSSSKRLTTQLQHSTRKQKLTTQSNQTMADNTNRNEIRLPLPSTRDAPRFSSKEPDEVGQFIERMEHLFVLSGLTGNKERKERLVKYADAQTEEEWKELPTFSDQAKTWEEFKEEILYSYPAYRSKTGSVAALDKICREHARLGRSHSEEVHSLVRKFRAQSSKLKSVYGNGALVEKFLACLILPFREAVLARALQLYGHHTDRKRHRDN
ncbi:hypothetical protein H0H93_015067, partial [Arthromyces matolae]